MPASEAMDKPIPSSMDDTRQELTKAKRGRRWGLWVLSGLVILVPLVVWGAMIMWRSTDLKPGDPGIYETLALKRQHELLGDAATEPNRWDELLDIAQELEQIARSLHAAPGQYDYGYVDFTVMGDPVFRIENYDTEPYSPEGSWLYEEYLRTHEHTLALTRKAMEQAAAARIEQRIAELIGARHMLRDGVLIREIEHLGAFRQSARYLSALIHSRVRQGDEEGAIRALESLLWLGQAIAGSGVVIDFLTGQSISMLAVRDAPAIARNAKEGSVSELLRVVERYRQSDAAVYAIEMERFHILGQFQPFFTDDGDGQGRFIGDSGGGWGQLLQRMNSGAQPGKAEVFDAINVYFAELVGVARLPAHRRLDELRTFSRPTGTLGMLALPIVSEIMPTMALYDGMHEERMALLRTYIAIEQHRRTRAELPESLDDLVPEFLPAPPSSPFVKAGGIHYELDPDVKGGFWLWGVGVDGVNNGGYWNQPGSGMWPGHDTVYWPDNPADYPTHGVAPPADPSGKIPVTLDYTIFHAPPSGG